MPKKNLKPKSKKQPASKGKIKVVNAETNEDDVSNLDDGLEPAENIVKSVPKPTELFLEEDVDGQKMYPVEDYSNKKKDAMLESAQRYRCKGKKFPQVNVNDLKSALKKDNKKGQFKNISNNKENKLEPQLPVKNVSSRVTRSHKQTFSMDTDNFFAVQSEKSVTSNNTLTKLRNKNLDEKKIQELLKDCNYIPKEHREIIDETYKSYKCRFIEWIQIMEEGFNVLLYGLGSKRSLINNFHSEMIADEPTLIINGFFPSLTIKEILDNIIVGLFGMETVSNQGECFDLIKKVMNAHQEDRIYLLIHNIDGEMLRSQKVQEILSRLASIPNIHLLASIDHINAPLIWDNVMRARYNFYWCEASTFLPYQAETSYESSLLIQKSGALALLSLKNIFASLTKNAKEIFLVLVKYQLENSGNNYTGMTFKDLYKASREAFLVSSDQALRAQLTEFIDHKLVKIKRNVDGAECLVILIDNSSLRHFIDQYNGES